MHDRIDIDVEHRLLLRPRDSGESSEEPEARVVDEHFDRPIECGDLRGDSLAFGIDAEVARDDFDATPPRRTHLRATSTRSYPRAASARAKATPNPLEAPATMAKESVAMMGRPFSNGGEAVIDPSDR